MPEIRYTFKGDASQINRAVSQLKRGFKGVEVSSASAFEKADRSSRQFAVGMAKVAIGVAAGVAALTALKRAGRAAFSFITDVTKTQDEIAKLSKRFGVSVEILSGFRLATELTGTSMQSLATGLRTAGRNALDASRGTGEAKESFEELGIAVTDAQGRLKTADRLIFEVADRFRGMDDAARKAALAQDIFGRSGSELVPLLDQGSEGIRRMVDDARRLGVVFDAEAAAKAEAFNDSVTRLGTAIDGLKFKSIGPLLPILTDAVDGLTETAAAGDQVSRTALGMARVTLVAAGSIVELSRTTLQFAKDAADAGLSVLRVEKGLLDVARLAPGLREIAGVIGGNLNERIKEGEQLSAALGAGVEGAERKMQSIGRVILKVDKALIDLIRSGRELSEGSPPPLAPPPGAIVDWKRLNEELEKALALGGKIASFAQTADLAPPIPPAAGMDIGTLGATGLAGVTFGGGGPTEESIQAAGIPGADQLHAALVQPFLDAAIEQDQAFAGITARSQQFLDEWSAIANRTIDVAGIFTSGVSQAFVGLGRALAGDGKNAVKHLIQFGAQILTQIGTTMIGQGIAQIVLGSSPMAPRPDWVAHGHILLAVGAGLAVAGGALSAVGGGAGGGAGGGGGGGFGGGGGGGNAFAAAGPAPIDIDSISQNQINTESSLAGTLEDLTAEVSRLRAFDAKTVVGMASRQSPTLIRGRAAGEIPPTG